MQPNNQPINPGQVPTQPPATAGLPTMPQQPGGLVSANSAQPQAPMQPSNVPSNPNSTQNTLQIAAIRDGLVIMTDGSFRAVVMAKSINFDLMSAQEQAAVEYAYQGFLNSLYFDVQIMIRSRKIDMRPYLEKLTKIRTDMENMLLGMLMEDYIYYIEDLVQQTNIMSKQFYIVVPYFSGVDAQKALQTSKKLLGGLLGGGQKAVVTVDEDSLEKAKTELANRVQSVVNGLLQMGVQAIPLDTQELIELYYNAYNPDTATRQTLQQMDQFSVPVVSKGDGQAPKPNIGGGV